MSRLKQRYVQEIVPAMVKEFEYSSDGNDHWLTPKDLKKMVEAMDAV